MVFVGQVGFRGFTDVVGEAVANDRAVFGSKNRDTDGGVVDSSCRGIKDGCHVAYLVNDKIHWTPVGDQDRDVSVCRDMEEQQIEHDHALDGYESIGTAGKRHCEDMLRVSGSLTTGTVRAYDLIRALGRDGQPTSLGQAFVDYGRIAKTLHLRAVCDPDDDSYRRSMTKQLTIQESRHRLARKIIYGQRGELRQKYREGQEDQLGLLGLAVNTNVLWTTRYLDAAVHQLDILGHPLHDEDLARISPLQDEHVEVLGHYNFNPPSIAALRPLRDPTAPEAD